MLLVRRVEGGPSGYLPFAVYLIDRHGHGTPQAALVSLDTLDLTTGAVTTKHQPAAKTGPSRDLELAMAPVALAWHPQRSRLLVAPPQQWVDRSR